LKEVEASRDAVGEEDSRLADLQRDVAFWRARAEAAEAVAAEWRTVQNRTLWKIFASLDHLRERIAPPQTRRERIVLTTARGVARTVAPLGRRPSEPKTFKPKGRKDVLFVYDDSGAWKFYRCDHQAEQLAYLGAPADIVQSSDVELVKTVDHYETFVLNRVAWTEQVDAFLDAAKAAGKQVFFGTDDLVFEPELERHFAFLDGARESDRQAWRERMDGYRRTLEACGRAIVSTDPLADHARHHVDHVDVVYNAVSAEMVRDADAVLKEARPSGGAVTIGYLSGTPSHNRDFLEAADAVLWALETCPDVRFVVVGKLDLDERFDRFGDRIMRIPKQRFHSLSTVTSQIDINLAPLERDNPFTDCKSCVKYLEAGLVGVPTIASARPDFVRVIEHGRNGFLADDATEWLDTLRALVDSPHLRRNLGIAAADDVRARHTTQAEARRLEILAPVPSPST
jgi:glycosyltransferase involved in cell wall biosynthesis